MKHTLGLDRKKKSYRNYFCAGPDHEDYPTLEKLVREGKMVRNDYPFNEMNVCYIYRMTPNGETTNTSYKSCKGETMRKTVTLCDRCKKVCREGGPYSPNGRVTNKDGYLSVSKLTYDGFTVCMAPEEGKDICPKCLDEWLVGLVNLRTKNPHLQEVVTRMGK